VSAQTTQNAVATGWTEPVVVTIDGYVDHAMEPFISRDGKRLYFNNRNDPKDQTDIHVARRKSKTHFVYEGRLANVNSDGLDGVASADSSGRFYFISTRDYAASGNTLWSGQLDGNQVINIGPLVTNFTAKEFLRLNIDMEISADGQTLYVAENKWDFFAGFPATSDIAMANRTETSFVRNPNSDALMAQVNSSLLEYAPATTADNLTLYFTRLNTKSLRNGKPDAFSIMVTTRKSQELPWEKPEKIMAIEGYNEAPTVTPDGCAIYFHRKVQEHFEIYYTERPACLKNIE
jgi:Tol biopolymer transport system component